MRWLIGHIFGGIVRFLVITVIGAICAVYGFAPSEFLASNLGWLPDWVVSPHARLAAVVAGVIIIVLIILLRPADTQSDSAEYMRARVELEKQRRLQDKQNQPERLKSPKPENELAAKIQDTLSASTIPTPYTSGETEDLLNALKDVHDFITKRIQPTFDSLNELYSNWRNYLVKGEAQTFAQSLLDKRTEMRAHWDEIDALINKYSYFQDEIKLALNLKKKPETIGDGMKSARRAFQSLPTEHPDQIAPLLGPHVEPLRVALKEFASWIEGSKEITRNMSSNLRKNRTTGYEQK
jgi:hypothetical protein